MLWVKEGGRSEMRAPGPESREPAPGRHRHKTEEGGHNTTLLISFSSLGPAISTGNEGALNMNDEQSKAQATE